MARNSNHRTVVFVKDFATKKAGEEFTCDPMLANTLIEQKVAKYRTQNNSSEKVSKPTDAGEASTVKVSEDKSSSKTKDKK